MIQRQDGSAQKHVYGTQEEAESMVVTLGGSVKPGSTKRALMPVFPRF